MHLHTKWSDGSLTVAELVQKLKENQISHAVLTDHDCILGNEQFQLECNRYNISTTVGTELEAYYDVNNSNYLHMLCYNFKDKDKLNSFLEEERSQRIYAINKAISILKKQHYNVNFEDASLRTLILNLPPLARSSANAVQVSILDTLPVFL